MLFVLLVLLLYSCGLGKPARPESLPKILWTYQEAEDPNFLHLLCLQRMRSVMEGSRWVLEVLTPKNLFVYLKQHEEYKSMLKGYRKHIEFREQVEIAKIFILKQYGGIWVDPDVILLEPIDWIHLLSSQQRLNNHGNPSYEVVIFQPLNHYSLNTLAEQQRQVYLQIFPINLGIILSLKQSPLMIKWIEELSHELKGGAAEPEGNGLLRMIKLALWKVLHDEKGKDMFKEYSVWSYDYQDYFDNVKSFANTPNQYVLADFYIKYPYYAILDNFGTPSHLVSLSQVSEQLDHILNPNISRLSQFSNIGIFSWLCPKDLSCAHYVRKDSLIFSLLLNGSRFLPEVQGLVLSDEQIGKCQSLLQYEWFWKLPLIIGLTACTVLAYLMWRVQWLCLQLLWGRALLFLKPRMILMLNIFKTVKNALQQSDNTI